ncbi:MAG TPA: hypothetical protein VMY78_12905 [Solirubrobacteraceae bacterium]|nr:hypothetical protein [Solirubrobacteraceae bacterium]
MQSIALPHRRQPLGARNTIVAALLAAVALAAVAAMATGAVHVPNLADALSDASESIGAWAYVLMPGLAFLETGAFVGLLVPGETAIVVGGVAAAGGQLSLPLLIGLVWMGALAGDVSSFLLGRRLGRPSSTRTPRSCASPRSAARRQRASSSATAAARSCSAGSSACCAR